MILRFLFPSKKVMYLFRVHLPVLGSDLSTNIALLLLLHLGTSTLTQTTTRLGNVKTSHDFK